MRFLAATCVLFLSFSGAALAQDLNKPASTRTVQLAPQFPDPVKIVRVLYDGAEIKPGLQAYPTDKPGVPFQAADDWFNHLTIVLKNTSKKRLVYADIRIFFLDLGDGTAQHPLVGDGNQIGQRPKHAQYSRIRGAWQSDPPRSPILVDPDQEFSLPAIDPGRFDEVKQVILERQQLSAVTLVRLDVPGSYFEDGTRWVAGYGRPDDAVPGKYLPISQEEFEEYRQEAAQ